MQNSNTQTEINQTGVIISDGLTDWQILQRNAEGLGCISLKGTWISETSGKVELRLVHEDNNLPISPHLDWQPALTQTDGSWSARLERVPSGGLYRLETRFNPTDNLASEWSRRGDMRHFSGVGDLWVIAGQSNSAGYGRGPIYDPPELGLHLFRNSMRWMVAAHPLNDSTDTAHPVNREESNPAHSPYLHFARLLKRQLGYPIGLVQTSLGGSSLNEWIPANPEFPAALFFNMVRCIEAVGGRVRGILWYQGEAEASSPHGERYESSFRQAVAAWREVLDDPMLPVLTVQLNRCHTTSTESLDRGWTQVREAQRQAARNIPGVGVVPSFDLPLSDAIHNSPAGNLLLGERLARLALGRVYGITHDCEAPDLQTALASPNKRSIELSFAPVTSRMDNIDPNANCFKVEDDAGNVPVEKLVYRGGAKIQLILERPLYGRSVVHGGYGIAPASVPIDVERFQPMLGFYNAKVEDASG